MCTLPCMYTVKFRVLWETSDSTEFKLYYLRGTIFWFVSWQKADGKKYFYLESLPLDTVWDIKKFALQVSNHGLEWLKDLSWASSLMFLGIALPCYTSIPGIFNLNAGEAIKRLPWVPLTTVWLRVPHEAPMESSVSRLSTHLKINSDNISK